ncbi:riboflavin synthase alpha chain [Nitrosomonas sp. Nm84]|uniref:riboflavin synthase n=1 Tax=Nitrosomonas sp. Nm84 TaxID=200124 RepID=UPI000D76F55C|nr:riboflavin synthase [Nitrosomonas sp. Nm84]PXW80340.1 riboflavin synthase alpha chain [Nitrosomonas sp. Nm84]
MFTGIIQAVGEIKQVQPMKNHGNQGLSLSIATGKLDLSDVLPGDSIAVNGVCLTVTALADDLFTVDVSQETLNCTYGLNQVAMRVNLEKAMRLSDRLGGHLVSGHVDAVGTVVKFESVGESFELIMRAPESILRYLAHKGSITVNGVSLTINQIEAHEFSINLIPHTLAMTTLNALIPGMRVNLETDMLARYVAKLLNI